MKSLMLLWKEIAFESAIWCHTSATHDYQTVMRRFEHEGLQFLTVNLPRFGKDLEKALELGKVTPYLFNGFHRRGELPVFLGGFVEKVFNRETGVLLDEPSVDSILAIRQLTLMFAKMQPTGDSHPGEAATMQKFIECEKEVRDGRNTSPDLVSRYQRMAHLLFRDVFTKLNAVAYRHEFVPRHGPGATADRKRGNAKFDQTTWPVRLDSCFPFGEYAIPSWRYSYLLDDVHFLEPGAEIPVRVITVPKTYQTPRIIAIEPVAMQYAQQSVLNSLVPALEEDSFLSPFVGFSDQTPNQRMAREGSLDRELATLDLSEASDRVSYQHVHDLFVKGQFSFFKDAVFACRSRKADVPGHGVIRLSKFASMGSALCFPFEEMVFLTIIFSSIEQELSTSFTRKDISTFAGKVRVYGDDIIVPVEYVQCVIDGLHAFGMKVNVDKSFWNGKFRESCGKEYYAGTDVSLVRVRKHFPSSRRDVPEVISIVSLRNQLYCAGYEKAVDFLDDAIMKILPYFPIVEETSPALGRLSFGPYQSERHCPTLQRPLVKAYVESSKPPPSKVSGEGALLKCLLKDSDKPFADASHLERSGRPQSSTLKLRLVTPY